METQPKINNEALARPPARALLTWGAVLVAAAAAWVVGLLTLPWWIALLIWWWPSALVGAMAGFLTLALAAGLPSRVLPQRGEGGSGRRRP